MYQMKSPFRQSLAVVTLLALQVLIGCAAALPGKAQSPSVAADQSARPKEPLPSPHPQPDVKGDAKELISILIGFADFSASELPGEKFARYFKTNLVWRPEPEGKVPGVFEGTAPAYGITVLGSISRKDQLVTRSGIWMKFPRTGRCVLLKDLLPHLPQLTLHLHGGPAITREDDPTQWEFYQTYAIESKSNRASYAFAFGINSDRIQPENQQCLRELTVSKYLP